MGKKKWPVWWHWSLEMTPHLFKRMMERRFTELDLRRMLERADGFRKDIVDGRWVIKTRFRRKQWEVIVEPDLEMEILVIITGYSVTED